MCFSPEASFAAGALLSAIGFATLKKVKAKREILFACLPFLFAIQQFTEGFLWIGLLQHKYLEMQHWLTIIFISFAGIVWPLLVPLSMFVMEKSGHRRRIIGIFFLSGMAIALITFKAIVNFGVTSEILHSCIRYDSPLKRSYYVVIFYIVATCGPLLYSSHRNINRIGALNIMALLVAYYFYEYNYASVWCFFASIISGMVYFHFAEKHSFKSLIFVNQRR